MLRSTVKLVSSVLMLRATGLILQMGWFVLLVRLLPIAEVGIYSAINALWVLMRALGPVGSDQALMRRLPSLLQEGRLAEARQWQHIALRYCLVRLLIALSVGLAGCAIAVWLGWWSAPWWLIALAGLTAIGYGVNGQQVYILLAAERPLLANSIDMLLLPVGLIMLTALLATTGQLTLLSLLLAQSLLIAGLCVLCLHYTRRVMRGEPSAETEALSPDSRREFSRQSYGLFATGALIHVNMRLPVVLAPFFIGAAATALLETAMRFAMLLGVMQFSAAQVLLPKLSAYCQQGKREKLQHILIEGSWLVFAPTLIGFAALALLGKTFLTLIAGEEYITAYLPMLLLGLGYVINASSGPMQHIFTMSGQARLVAQISASEMLLSLLMIFWLSAQYGAQGMALAVATGMCLRNGLFQAMLPRRLELRPGVWSLSSIRWLLHHRGRA